MTDTPREMKLITDEGIIKAWVAIFSKTFYFSKEPTEDELLMIRLKSVAIAQLKADTEAQVESDIEL